MQRLPLPSLITRRRRLATEYDPASDPVHGGGWNTAARWGGWHWRQPRTGEFFRTCSFCGCIHPADLLSVPAGTGGCATCGKTSWEACFYQQQEAVSLGQSHKYDPGGWYVSWADRKYGWPHKFYVENLPNPDAGRLWVLGSSNYPPGDESRSWVHISKLNRMQRRAVNEGGYRDKKSQWKPEWFQFGTKPTLHAKFYTAHLADPSLPVSTKEAVQRLSGLRFFFDDQGGVSWEAYRPGG